MCASFTICTHNCNVLLKVETVRATDVLIEMQHSGRTDILYTRQSLSLSLYYAHKKQYAFVEDYTHLKGRGKLL